jgi:bifunctional DNase/RNase
MKREVKIISLAYAQSQVGSYVVVLSETNGFRKLPVVIKTTDAQQIALKLEKMDSPRPTTHDLISNLSAAFNIECTESCIYGVVEGIFYSKSTFRNGVDDINIECSCGDAILLSLNFGCPLYVNEEVHGRFWYQGKNEARYVPLCARVVWRNQSAPGGTYR